MQLQSRPTTVGGGGHSFGELFEECECDLLGCDLLGCDLLDCDSFDCDSFGCDSFGCNSFDYNATAPQLLG